MATGPGDTGAATVSRALVAPATGPAGGTVTAGRGSIRQHGLTTTIDQRSQNLSLNWQSFDVGAASTVNFAQPNAQSIAVNRIAGSNSSVILGHLNANGQVFLINPNGVLFGRSAQVNVGGLVASTLDLGDGELSGGTRHFFGGDQGSVINQGRLSANEGGYIALLGPQVTNQGTLSAPGGTVAMGGGNAVTLSFDANRLLSLEVDRSTLNALADNRQLIVANGGQVLMSAGAKDALLSSVVNNSGVIQAQTVAHRDGRIVLLGGMAAGTTQVAGTLDASAPAGGDGGFIETSASHVTVADGAKITTLAHTGQTGTWLIDPQDYTIAASGGDMTGAALSTNLASTDVSIQSSDGTISSGAGDINLNDAVSWNANTTLTLTASNNVNINANVTATGASAGLVLAPNTASGGQYHLANGAVITLSGAAPTLSIAGRSYTVINSLGAPNSNTGTDLEGMNGNLAGNYALGSDIDASATSSSSAGGFVEYGGFVPIGGSFQGTFDGLGHVITGLYGSNFFGTTAAGSVVRNVGLLARSATGGNNFAGLVRNNFGTIDQTFVSGNVIGYGYYIGGLVSSNFGAISRSHVDGVVTGQGNIGGLVGTNNSGATITQSYVTATVSGVERIGGLVGLNNGATISQSYTTGPVNGTVAVGGLAGVVQPYEPADPALRLESHVTQTWASGKVTGSSQTGGLIGVNFSPSSGYWDSYSSGQAAGIGAGYNYALPTFTSDPAHAADGNSAFKQSAYVGFDFTAGNGGWVMLEGSTRPFLQAEYSVNIRDMHQLQLAATRPDAAYVLANDLDASATKLAVNRATPGDAAGMWSADGFDPIGDTSTRFTGSLDGQGHAITGLTINRPTTDDVGLFGDTGTGSTIHNLGLIGGSTTGQSSVGALVGNNAGTISQAYASGPVTGSANVGGLVGTSQGAMISQSYATGAVTGTGGAAANIGGLVGSNSSALDQVYASGVVSGGDPGSTGGLAGASSGIFTNSHWDTFSTGQASAVGSDPGTGITAVTSDPAGGGSAFSPGAYTGFDFTGTWFMINGSTRPFLQSEYSTNISNVHQLQMMAMHPAANYTVTNDFAASATGRAVNSAAPSDAGGMWGSAGFSPVGDAATAFTGTFDGQGYSITDLTINQPAGVGVSLFGYAAGSIRDLNLLGASVTGANSVGGLVGFNTGPISRVHVTGAVSGGAWVGGLVGFQQGSTISQSYVTATVTGPYGVGGLAGQNGGGAISQSYSTGAVSGDGASGGLVGTNHGSITQSYATGAVSGNNMVGGLVGDGTYASGTIQQSYATGAVSGTSDVGGLIGAGGGTVTASYWDTQTSHQTTSAGGSGLTTALMMDPASFVSWVIASAGGSNAAWRIYSGQTTPLLRTFMTGLTITANNATSTYNGTAFAGGTYTLGTPAPSYWLLPAVANPALVLGTLNTAAPAINARTYTLDHGLHSNQTGYDITLTPGTLTISPAPLSITGASAVSKTYDGNTAATISNATLDGSIYGTDAQALTLDNANTGTFADKNAGTGKTVTMAATLSGTSATNYQLTQPSGLTADITAKAISSVDGITADGRAYDGSTDATLGYGSAVPHGMVAGDSLTAGGATGVFDNKNVGTGKNVSITGITLSGTDKGNYTLTNTTASASADITQAPLTISTNDGSKVYDGSTTASGSPLVTTGTVFTGDSLSGGTFTFVDKNVGTGKTVDVAGVTVGDANGNDGNYAVNYVPNTHSSITARPVDVELPAAIANVSGITADDKIYDGTINATLDFGSAIFNGMARGDSLAVGSAIGVFSDKNAGIGKTVFISGISLGGSDARNYRLVDTTARSTANITPLGITVMAGGQNKVYDSTTTADVALVSHGILAGDNVNFNASSHFADANAGTAKPITVSDIAAVGTDAGNYHINSSASTRADITPATLTYLAKPGSATVGWAPTGLAGVITGWLGADTLATASTGTPDWNTPASVSSPTGQYAIDGAGLSAANYIFQQAATNASALQLTAGSASATTTPTGVATIIAQLQQRSQSVSTNQQQDSDQWRAPSDPKSHAASTRLAVPNVRIINGGVRMP